MGLAAGTVSEVAPTAGRMLDGGFVNSAVNMPLIRKDVLFILSYVWVRYEIFVLELNLIKISYL